MTMKRSGPLDDRLEPNLFVDLDDSKTEFLQSIAISAKREADATHKMADALEEFLAWTKQRWDR